jgi:6-phosphogluconolactonase (cycloisomerase 2 family)
MDKTVPRATGEFLFLGDAGAPLITGFRINGDGSLAPVPGSPFAISALARGLQSLNNLLIVKTDKTTFTFTVEKETGSLQQTASIDTSIAGSDISGPVSIQSAPAALDISGKFMYIADRNRAEVLVYRVDGGMLSALSPSYPVPIGTTSIVLVKP